MLRMTQVPRGVLLSVEGGVAYSDRWYPRAPRDLRFSETHVLLSQDRVLWQVPLPWLLGN